MRSPFRRHLPRAGFRAAGETAEVLLYDEIGYFGITAKEFVTRLQAIEAETIHLRVNSPGGDVFDGLTIANALRGHQAQVIVHVDGLAASIASIIALAGDEVRMAENAFLMIHDPFTIAIGNAEDFRKVAGTLDKVAGVLADTYRAKSGAETEQVKQWMADETWFTAQEAVDAGLADTAEAPSEARASFDLSVFAKAPDALRARQAGPTIRDCERALREAGLSATDAKAVLAKGFNAVDPREADEAATREAVHQLLTTLKG